LFIVCRFNIPHMLKELKIVSKSRMWNNSISELLSVA